jgi:uncharacterized protein
MQFIPIIERVTGADQRPPARRGVDRVLEGERLPGGSVIDRTVSPAGYGRFLIDVFEEWVRSDVARVYV